MTGKLEEDIRFTAESFTRNFADRGNFDFSIENQKRVQKPEAVFHTSQRILGESVIEAFRKESA